jgi:hypothetical protein
MIRKIGKEKKGSDQMQEMKIGEKMRRERRGNN